MLSFFSFFTKEDIIMSLACAGYSRHGEFLFISRNSDKNDFHLDTVSGGIGASVSYSQPLLNITGYPNNGNKFFNGLCSFSKYSDSFFLSFDNYNISTESPVDITTLSDIYQLKYKNGTNGSGNQLEKTPIQLVNTTLVSFAEVTTDTNKNSSLAFITTSQASNNNQPQFTLNINSLSNPNLHSISKPISKSGILAVGGEYSQILYLLQSNTISEYRFDTMDYTQFNLSTNFEAMSTSGQVFSVNNSNYISVYNVERSEINIFQHNFTRSSFSPLPLSNGYISFGNNVNDIPDTGNNKAEGTKISNSSESTNRKKGTISKTIAVASSSSHGLSPTIQISGKSKRKNVNEAHLVKRELLQTGLVTSADGSFKYEKFNLESEDHSPVLAAILSDPISPQDNPPYYITFLSGNEQTGYKSNIMTGTGESTSNNNSDGRGLPTTNIERDGIGGGAIAGIVISVILSLIFVFGLLIYARKRKNRLQISYYNSMPVSIQPDNFVSRYVKQPDTKSDDNHSNTSSILQESKCIPEEYHDGIRPDIRPLCYNTDKIEYATPSQNELTMLEPDVHGPLFMFSGQYTSTVNEKVVYLNEGYAIRTFSARDGSKHTVHYFSSANLDSFVRSVYAVTRCKTSKKENKIMRSDMAIVLGKPTPHFNYQYIWITSPMIPEQSLYHLLFERKAWSYNIDYHHIDYKIWSIYTILKNVETVHNHQFVHLAIDLKAFYYDHESKPTDWRLGNFCYARTEAKNNNYLVLPPSNNFTAPEIINQKAGAEVQAADIWSTACVIYTAATGGLSLFENDEQVKALATFKDDLEQHIKIAVRDNIDNTTFKTILEMMLIVDPRERKSIAQVLDFWSSIYNMEG